MPFVNCRLMRFDDFYDGPMTEEDIMLRVKYVKENKPWTVEYIYYDHRNLPQYLQLAINGAHNLSRVKKAMKIADESDKKNDTPHHQASSLSSKAE